MQDITALIHAQLHALLAGKGAALPVLDDQTLFLGGDLDIDSLDLATLVVTLEELTGKQPFREGFREFRTVGELARLFAA
jgi:acyl carrier protein